MLETLNRYSHGFVAAPVIAACRRGGVFEALAEGRSTVGALTGATRANEGHLRAALRLLCSLGLVSMEGDEVSSGPRIDDARHVPEGVVALLSVLDADLAGESGRLASWMDVSTRRWGAPGPLADLLDGTIVVPLLADLHRTARLRRFLEDDDFLDSLGRGARDAVAAFFVARGWASATEDGEGIVSTEAGRFFAERALVAGMLASYRPMLAGLPALLFGDPRSVFGRTEGGQERHLDRTMNVVGSGFQHDRFFRAMDEMIVGLFDREPLEAQPRYVVDMGCGDGTLLRRIYETVREGTARGRALDTHPLTLVGADFNEAALEATRRTLSGLPHLTLRGDIADPEALIADLAARDIDPETVLHVRSFLDHDRPFVAPADAERLARRAPAARGGVFVDAGGESIAPAAVRQSLVEHFERWAKVVNRHGLLVLEVHCLDAATAATYADSSQNIHFDAFHAFSMQQLVEAAEYVGAAAEAGLLAGRGDAHRFPRVLPYTRITLTRLEKRPYSIRPADATDVPALVALERAAWAEVLAASPEEIGRRVSAQPGAVLVVEQSGDLLAVLYSQRVASVEAIAASRHADTPRLGDARGPVVQLLGLAVDPAVQGRGLADALLEHALQRAALLPGVTTVAGVTRCRRYERGGSLSLEDHVALRDGSGARRDPGVRFHEAHGAQVAAVLRDYRPEDAANEGAGVLITYDLATRETAEEPSGTPAATAGGDLETTVTRCVKEILGTRRAAAFAADRPWREMGLDSLDLLELRALLLRRTGLDVEPTAFFSHRHVAALAAHLRTRGGIPVATLPKAPPTRPASRQRLVGPPPSRTGHAPIAVVGLACRFPGAADAAAFWSLLESGRSAVGDGLARRWSGTDWTGVDPEMVATVGFGGTLEDVDRFDASFFGISPREARRMDPQQRILLETAWHAFEDAGIDPSSLARSATGVFVGISSHDYELLQVRRGGAQAFDAHFATGGSTAVAAGRLSYAFGLQGPALALDTACSSSLVAVHTAAGALRSGECDLAVAGGVGLLLAPELSLAYARARMLAADGRCKTFDAGADGYVRGEGCGLVVLKRLDDAFADGDRILAVVRGSAVNQDGPSNGLTAPNGDAQEALLRRALVSAGLSPADVSYVEAHGTGTSLGDPIEVSAIGRVYGEGRKAGDVLRLGSVKTVIGHLEAAAGIAGLIKVILSLRGQSLPPHLNFGRPNPLLELSAIPAEIPVARQAWVRRDEPRRAGVSSFGFSGTNAHVILEEAPAVPPEESDGRGAHVLAVSAKSPEALQAMTEGYRAFLEAHPDTAAGDLCRTANAGRAHHDHRLAMVFETVADLKETLKDEAAGGGRRAFRSRPGTREPRIAFLFSGQGAQYAGMGGELLAREPAFRDAIEECGGVLEADLGRPLVDILHERARIDETALLQPVLFSVEYALARLWRSWGLAPAAVLGHSLGEYVAACIAGVFGVRDALRLVAARGRLMSGLPEPGAMAAVAAPEEVVRRALAPYEADLAIACLNAPESVVVSGRAAALEGLLSALEGRGIRCRRLAVSNAFHSPLMEPILGEFEAVVGSLALAPPELPLVSNLLGTVVTDDVTEPTYWRRHLREAVRFADGVRAVAALGADVFLEVGPGTTLLSLTRATLGEGDALYLPSLAPGAEAAGLMGSLASLYARGAGVEWGAVETTGRVISAPLYRFQRERFWFEEEPAATAVGAAATPETGDGRVLTDYYNALAESQGDSELRFVNFAPFPEIRPDFSWVRALGGSQGAGELTPLILDAQSEMRRVLFRRVDWKRAVRAFDIGCGYGSDLIDLARAHTHLQVAGFSLSDEQVAVANRRAGEAGVADRLHAQQRNSATEPYPGVQDVVFGFEVAHHVTDKEALFANISHHLREDGYLLLADFVSEAAFPIEHPVTSSFFPTRAQWTALLSKNGLELEEYVDLSPEVANFLSDPDFDGNLDIVLRESRDPNIREAFRSYDQLGKLLRKGLARYVLIAARKRAGTPATALEKAARDGLARPRSWSEVALVAGAYEKTWRPQEPLARADLAGRWLVLAGDGAAGTELADDIRERGGSCEVVRRLGGEELSHRVSTWAARGGRGIVHVAALDDGDLSGEAVAAAAETLRVAVQALLRTAADPRPRLHVVTGGGEAASQGAVRPLSSALGGLARTIRAEHPEVFGRLIDVDPATPAMEAVADELGSEDGEAIVVHRGANRSALRLRRRTLPPPQGLPVQRDGSYWISGGLGAVGLAVAERLAQGGAGHLVLLSRRPASEETSARLERLRAGGTGVTVASLDVGDAGALTALHEQCVTALPPLRGIVHAAGVLRDAVLLHQEAEGFAEVLRPKVMGALHLDALSGGVPLDFFILVSSIASLLGGQGQGAYAAANAFLDGLAWRRAERGQPALSLSLGPIGDAGMAARLDPGRRDRWKAAGFGMLSLPEVLDRLGGLVAEGVPHVAIAPIDWAVWRRRSGAACSEVADLVRTTSGEAPSEAADVATMRQELEALPPEKRRDRLTAHVRGIAAKVLGSYSAASVDPERGFWAMGMDSLLSLEFRNRLQVDLGCRLAATVTMDHPNVRAMVEHVGRRLELFGASSPAAAVPASSATTPAAPATDIDSLSESEAEALLLNRLREMEY